MSAVEEIVGWDHTPATPEKRGRGRPPAAETENRRLAVNLQAEALGEESSHTRVGVTVSWLANAFRMDSKTCKNRLAELRPIGLSARGTGTYDFCAAASYLAKPPPDQFARYMRSLRVQDMPTHLQETYWGALRKKQLWEIHAGDLWKTADVLDVLGETFKAMKSSMQLWVDNLDRKGELSPEQRLKITQMVDSLQDDLYQRLVEMPKERQTTSSLDDSEINPASAPLVETDEDLIG